MNVNDAILSALAYHDIFNFPLKLEEINKYLPQKSIPEKTEIAINDLMKKGKVGKYSEYYFLKKRKDLVKLRKSRKSVSVKKKQTRQCLRKNP